MTGPNAVRRMLPRAYGTVCSEFSRSDVMNQANYTPLASFGSRISDADRVYNVCQAHMCRELAAPQFSAGLA